MPIGPSTAAANTMLAALVGLGPLYIKLHVGDPGAAGTSSPAVNVTRKLVTWGSPSGGQVANSVALSWTAAEVNPASLTAGTTIEDVAFASYWTAPTGGTFVDSAAVNANPSVAGNTATLPIGAATIKIPTLAA